MALESKTTSTTFKSGSMNKRDVSCVGVAGTGLPAAYYETSGTIEVTITEFLEVYLDMKSIVVHQNDISDANDDGSWGSDTWTFHGLYVSPKSFTLTDGPSGPSGYGEGKQLYTSGHISHDGYGTGNASSHYSFLSTGSSTGLQKIASSIDQIEHNSDYTEIYLYAGGLIDYSSSPTSSISIPAARITLKAEQPMYPEDTEELWYPWSRMISNAYQSLNRNGTNTTSTGLFRYNNGYKKCTNSSNGAASSHGFRYNNGWQVSPKSGVTTVSNAITLS